MKHVTMNKTTLEVSEICLGGAGFGSKLDRDTTFAVLDRFRDHGGNFVDTANIYVRDFNAGYSVSERLIGEYLKTRGKNALVVATKGAHPNPATMHTPRLNRAAIEHDLDESLASLGLDQIDFYWLHRDDPAMPIGEIIELLEAFVRSGKIRYYGASNYSAARMNEAHAYACAQGLAGFAGVSNMWFPAVMNENTHLTSDDTLVCFTDKDLALFEQTGMAFAPYNSTAKGWFAKFAAGIHDDRLDAIFENPVNLTLLEKLKARACEGLSVQAALLDHILTYPMQILPITSVSSIGQLDDILRR